VAIAIAEFPGTRALLLSHRQLRQDWGKEYKEKYIALKKNKGEWKRQLGVFKLNNPRTGKKGRRSIRYDTHTLCKKKLKSRGTLRRKTRQPMTADQFQEWFCSSAGGNHTKEQCLEAWREMERNGTKADTRGVYQG
jgi:hypothetical protein